MSVLASLTKAYERLPDLPPFGYVRTEIAFCVVLKPDGHPPFLQLISDNRNASAKSDG